MLLGGLGTGSAAGGALILVRVVCGGRAGKGQRQGRHSKQRQSNLLPHGANLPFLCAYGVS